MRTLKHLMIGLISVAFLISAVALVQPPASQALDLKGGFQFKKILKKIFPACGPGTRHERFVVKGEKVCDNKTGLWWQRTPGEPNDGTCGNTNTCKWEQAKDYYTNLELNGKHKKKQWRLAEVKELISLVDYSVVFPGPVLPPGNPFNSVQQSPYWSATGVAGFSDSAWIVEFNSGVVDSHGKGDFLHAWCVSGGQDAH